MFRQCAVAASAACRVIDGDAKVHVSAVCRGRLGFFNRRHERGGQPVSTSDDREAHAVLDAAFRFDGEGAAQ
jgi:hypothetical protein